MTQKTVLINYMCPQHGYPQQSRSLVLILLIFKQLLTDITLFFWRRFGHLTCRIPHLDISFITYFTGNLKHFWWFLFMSQTFKYWSLQDSFLWMLLFFSCCAVCLVCAVMSSSLWPHGLWPTRLLCPWDFPGKSTGVSCHALLKGIFLTQGSSPVYPALQPDSLPSEPPGKHILYMDSQILTDC